MITRAGPAENGGAAFLLKTGRWLRVDNETSKVPKYQIGLQRFSTDKSMLNAMFLLETQIIKVVTHPAYAY